MTLPNNILNKIDEVKNSIINKIDTKADITHIHTSHSNTSIVGNTDLNNITTEGWYNCASNATAKTCSNTPWQSTPPQEGEGVGKAFAMVVLRSYRIIQILITYEGLECWYRAFSEMTDSTWKRFYTETNLTKNDIVNLGIPASDTVYTHPNSGVTAGTNYNGSQSPTFGGNFSIPKLTYNAQGHITGSGNATVTIPNLPTLEIVEKATPNTNAFRTYQIMQNNSPISGDIDIPENNLIKSGSVETATANTGHGLNAGDKYISLIIDDGTVSGTELVIPVAGLITNYTADNNTLQLLNSQFSIKDSGVTYNKINSNAIGNGSNQIASGNHLHGNLQNNGAIGTTNNTNKNVVTDSNGYITTEDKPIAIYYGTCATAAATQIKEVSAPNFILNTGAVLNVKFTYQQTYNASTSAPMQLKINNDIIKDVAYVGTTKTTRYHWTAGEIVSFLYDGTNFVIIDGGLASVTYYGVTKLSSAIDSTSESYAATPKAISTHGHGNLSKDGKLGTENNTNKNVVTNNEGEITTEDKPTLNSLGGDITIESTYDTNNVGIYTIKQGGVSKGTINIPRDFVVRSGSVKTATANTGQGLSTGNKYISLILNAKDYPQSNVGQELVIPVNDLISDLLTEEDLEAINIDLDSSSQELWQGLSSPNNVQDGLDRIVGQLYNHNHNNLYIAKGTGTVTSTNIADGTITSTDIASNTIKNSNIATNAAISYSKLSGVASDNHTHYYSEILDVPDIIEEVTQALEEIDRNLDNYS